MTISVLLADDSEIMRKAIVDLLKTDPEVKVVAEAVSLKQTRQLAMALHPQVVILDMHLKDGKGMTPKEVKSCLTGSRVLAISLWKDEGTKALAESYGAVVLLDKVNLAGELISAIHSHSK